MRSIRRGFDQDFDVLDGGDDVILDLLTPQPPPTGALEVMTRGRGKTAFHEMSPAGAIPPRLRTGCLFVREVDQLLRVVVHDRAAGLGPRALRS